MGLGYVIWGVGYRWKGWRSSNAGGGNTVRGLEGGERGFSGKRDLRDTVGGGEGWGLGWAGCGGGVWMLGHTVVWWWKGMRPGTGQGQNSFLYYFIFLILSLMWFGSGDGNLIQCLDSMSKTRLSVFLAAPCDQQ